MSVMNSVAIIVWALCVSVQIVNGYPYTLCPQNGASLFADTGPLFVPGPSDNFRSMPYPNQFMVLAEQNVGTAADRWMPTAQVLADNIMPQNVYKHSSNDMRPPLTASAVMGNLKEADLQMKPMKPASAEKSTSSETGLLLNNENTQIIGSIQGSNAASSNDEKWKSTDIKGDGQLLIKTLSTRSNDGEGNEGSDEKLKSILTTTTQKSIVNLSGCTCTNKESDQNMLEKSVTTSTSEMPPQSKPSM